MTPQGIVRAVAGGYVPPTKRQACRNCAHGDVRPSAATAQFDRKQVRCSVFRADLNLGGVCPRWAARVSGLAA